MRVIKGFANAILMVTLIRPMVRVMVSRWRKRAQESPATAIGLQVQELFEAALVEELAPSYAMGEDAPRDIAERAESDESAEGRSALRVALVVSVVIALGTASAYAARELLRRRRAAQAQVRELVAVPIETGETDALEDVALEALAEEG